MYFYALRRAPNINKTDKSGAALAEMRGPQKLAGCSRHPHVVPYTVLRVSEEPSLRTTECSLKQFSNFRHCLTRLCKQLTRYSSTFEEPEAFFSPQLESRGKFLHLYLQTPQFPPTQTLKPHCTTHVFTPQLSQRSIPKGGIVGLGLRPLQAASGLVLSLVKAVLSAEGQ